MNKQDIVDKEQRIGSKVKHLSLLEISNDIKYFENELLKAKNPNRITVLQENIRIGKELSILRAQLISLGDYEN
jgi:hypothetical protein